MGYYIETGSNKNKANWLIINAQAEHGRIGTKEMIPVVVVDNGPFEAAAIAYNEGELAVFSRASDTRPKTFLLVPRAEIIRLCPKVEDKLNWPAAD